jgi:hypothetical protein
MLRFTTILNICIITVLLLFSCKNDKKTIQTVQNTEGVGIPPAVTDFATRFPKAQDVYWDTLDVGYSITFNDGTYDCKAIFDAAGKFQHQIKMIELEALPQAIQKFLNDRYKEAEIAILQLVITDTKKGYQIELQSNTDYISLEFDDKGTLIKEIKDPLSSEELEGQEEEGVEKSNKQE